MRAADRRHRANLALEYLAIAGGAGAAGVILLLLFGTQVLNWYWPVVLFAVALAAGLMRLRQRRLTRYRLAQVVDARLGLEDRLSTLFWFRDAGADPEALKAVEQQALARLHPEEMGQAMPVRFPRYGYMCAALAAAAAGLLGVRYGMLHTMDLRPPLARISFDTPFAIEPKAEASTRKTAIQERWEEQLKQLGLTPQDLEMPIEKGFEDTPVSESESPQGMPAPSDKGSKGLQAPEGAPEDGEEMASGEKSDGNGNNEGSSGDSAKGRNEQNSQKPPSQNAKSGEQNGDSGLMNKMKDALANLMNKLKTSSQQQGQQTASNQQGQQGQQQQQNARQQQQSAQGAQSQSQQGGEGSADQDQQGNQDQASDQAGDKSRSGQNSADRPGQQSAKSGMGQQDGDKALQEARQMEAMGKLSEILGKRAQQVTGEMTVEVASGRQQLKTAWSNRQASHADTGAESNRNEIPLEYQTYIQRYFEAIRKSPGGSSRNGMAR